VEARWSKGPLTTVVKRVWPQQGGDGGEGGESHPEQERSQVSKKKKKKKDGWLAGGKFAGGSLVEGVRKKKPS